MIDDRSQLREKRIPTATTDENENKTDKMTVQHLEAAHPCFQELGIDKMDDSMLVERLQRVIVELAEERNAYRQEKNVYKKKLALAKIAYEKLQQAYWRLMELKSRLETDATTKLVEQEGKGHQVDDDFRSHDVRLGVADVPSTKTNNGDMARSDWEMKRNDMSNASPDAGARSVARIDDASPTTEYTPTQTPYSAMRQIGLLSAEPSTTSGGSPDVQSHKGRQVQAVVLQSSSEKKKERQSSIQDKEHGSLELHPKSLPFTYKSRGVKSPAWKAVQEKRKELINSEDLNEFWPPDKKTPRTERIMVQGGQDSGQQQPAGNCEECKRYFSILETHGIEAAKNGLTKPLCGHGIQQQEGLQQSHDTNQHAVSPPDMWHITMD